MKLHANNINGNVVLGGRVCFRFDNIILQGRAKEKLTITSSTV